MNASTGTTAAPRISSDNLPISSQYLMLQLTPEVNEERLEIEIDEFLNKCTRVPQNYERLDEFDYSAQYLYREHAAHVQISVRRVYDNENDEDTRIALLFDTVDYDEENEGLLPIFREIKRSFRNIFYPDRRSSVDNEYELCVIFDDIRAILFGLHPVQYTVFAEWDHLVYTVATHDDSAEAYVFANCLASLRREAIQVLSDVDTRPAIMAFATRLLFSHQRLTLLDMQRGTFDAASELYALNRVAHTETLAYYGEPDEYNAYEQANMMIAELTNTLDN